MTTVPQTKPAAETVVGAEWRAIVARYQEPNVGRAIIEVLTTMVPLAIVFYLMFLSLALPYVVTLLLALPAAGLLVRTFIIMHDCAHGSFVPSRRVSDLVGYITGVLTLTPFAQWRRDHALHHASSGDLDRRGHGDVTTLTVREYLGRTPWGRLKYRLFRNPLVLLVLGPLNLILLQRIPPRGAAARDRQVASVWATNAGIAVLIVAFGLLIGFRALLLIYGPAYFLAAAIGVWLFYVQHQFEDTYWEEHGEWNYVTACIHGSSYLRLPGVLAWFTGHIGLHHVHHLGPRIPNYNLQRCHDENPLFHDATIMTLAQGAAALRLTLWDEDRHRLVRFADVRGRVAPSASPAKGV